MYDCPIFVTASNTRERQYSGMLRVHESSVKSCHRRHWPVYIGNGGQFGVKPMQIVPTYDGNLLLPKCCRTNLP